MTPDESRLAEAIRNLRSSIGDTQAQFSARLGVTVRTLARYELEQPPKSKHVLLKLAQLADEHEQYETKDVFTHATDLVRTPTAMASAIRRLRLRLGDTQQQFATRTGLAAVSIARYEMTARASIHALRKLAELSRSHGLEEYAEIFEGARSPEDRPADEKQWILEQLKMAVERLTTSSYRRARCAMGVLFCNDVMLRKVEALLAYELAINDQLIGGAIPEVLEALKKGKAEPRGKDDQA